MPLTSRYSSDDHRRPALGAERLDDAVLGLAPARDRPGQRLAAGVRERRSGPPARPTALRLDQAGVAQETQVAGQGGPVHHQCVRQSSLVDRPAQRQRPEQGELGRPEADRRQRVIEVLGHGARGPAQVEAGAGRGDTAAEGLAASQDRWTWQRLLHGGPSKHSKCTRSGDCRATRSEGRRAWNEDWRMHARLYASTAARNHRRPKLLTNSGCTCSRALLPFIGQDYTALEASEKGLSRRVHRAALHGGTLAVQHAARVASPTTSQSRGSSSG